MMQPDSDADSDADAAGAHLDFARAVGAQHADVHADGLEVSLHLERQMPLLSDDGRTD